MQWKIEYALLALLLVSGCTSRREKVLLEPIPFPEATNNSGQPHSPNEAPQQKVSAHYAWIQKNLLNTHCLSCHSSASTGYDFSNYEGLMNSGLIIPQQPERSEFYLSLVSREMPLDGSIISPSTIELVREWILDGAKEN